MYTYKLFKRNKDGTYRGIRYSPSGKLSISAPEESYELNKRYKTHTEPGFHTYTLTDENKEILLECAKDNNWALLFCCIGDITSKELVTFTTGVKMNCYTSNKIKLLHEVKGEVFE